MGMTMKKSDSIFTVCVLASGSKGNAIFISDGVTSVLVDAGLSGKEIQKRMSMRGLCPTCLDAILITHEHTDHIKGAGIMSRRFKLPLYINEKTFQAGESLMGTPHERITIDCGRDFLIADWTVHPFSTSHDAADPTGFTISKQGVKIGVATDLGMANLVVRDHLKNADLLILESNHDPAMLLANENYPWPLKQRVKGRKGHLANEDTHELLSELIHDQLQHVVLAHLSEENNTREIALETATRALNGFKTVIVVADQHEPGELIQVFDRVRIVNTATG
jgi:phosphoribosyl 1,2-cyclic phosphodiesterase